MTQTTGEYAKEKMENMARWVHNVVGKENLSADIIADINGRSVLEVMVLCTTLQANENIVAQRDWSGLGDLLKETNHAVMKEVYALIEHREVMHEKFWRYMELFVELGK